MVWKFVESEDDGRMWMQNPTELWAAVDFRSNDRVEWRRIMVVTKAWVEKQLADVKISSARPGHTVFASMLVLPNAPASQLREFIDSALASGGVEHFASVAGEV